jgi:RNA polymerase sigma-70 factor, ECF subfamily
MPSRLALKPRSDALVDRLRGGRWEREGALAELHALLLRAARFEVARRRPMLPHLRGNELDDIALEAADDALVAVLAKLDDFRGASRFTTWAYKFALLETASKLRRRAWQRREIPLEPEDWWVFSDPAGSPSAEVERAELLSALQRAIATTLTPRQRDVLVAVALNGVPTDVLAERFGTSRGAVYKALHDARLKLRSELDHFGFERLPTAA